MFQVSAFDAFLKLKQSLCCNTYWVIFFLNILNNAFFIVEWRRYFLWQTKALKNSASVKNILLILSRSTFLEVFLGKGVLKICSKFTWENPGGNVISIKLLFKVAFRLYWDRTSAGVFSCKFAAYVQFSIRTPMEGCFGLLSLLLPLSLHVTSAKIKKKQTKTTASRRFCLSLIRCIPLL